MNTNHQEPYLIFENFPPMQMRNEKNITVEMKIRRKKCKVSRIKEFQGEYMSKFDQSSLTLAPNLSRIGRCAGVMPLY